MGSITNVDPSLTGENAGSPNATQRYAYQHSQEPPVLILVGSSKKPFYIHRSLLREQSPYFSARLKECWDGTEKSIELYHIETTAFEAVVQWMYTKTLLPNLLELNLEPSGNKYGISHMMKAYKVADMLMMPELQNKIMDQLVLCNEKKNCSMGPITLRHILDELRHTPCYKFAIKSAVRNIMVHSRAKDCWNDGLKQFHEYPDVMQDIILGIISWNKQPWTARCAEDLCDFHIHSNGHRCPK